MPFSDTVSCWIFDLDGTLSDPIEGMVASFNHALLQSGYDLAPVDQLTLRPHIGPPLEETFALLSGSNDKTVINTLIQLYREHYRETGYALNTVYKGVVNMLDSLADNGARLAVCTAKTQPVAEKVLSLHGLLDRFEFVSGGDVGISKSQQLETALQLKLIDNQAVMVGDRRYDMQAAQDNNLVACGVLWGYGTQQELMEYPPKIVVERPQEIVELFKELDLHS